MDAWLAKVRMHYSSLPSAKHRIIIFVTCCGNCGASKTRMIGMTNSPQKYLLLANNDGGRDRDRTCDFHRVKVALYR